MEKINTLDLDKIDKEKLKHITDKIKQCKNLLSISVKDSNSKGYHAILICKIECDLCRFLFDDSKRYEIDFNKPAKFQNCMFEEKIYFRNKRGF